VGVPFFLNLIKSKIMAINLKKYDNEFAVQLTFGVNIKALAKLVSMKFNNNSAVLRLFDSAVKSGDYETLLKVFIELSSDELLVDKLFKADDIIAVKNDDDDDDDNDYDDYEEPVVRWSKSGGIWTDEGGYTMRISDARKFLADLDIVGIAKVNGEWVAVTRKYPRRKDKKTFEVKTVHEKRVHVYKSEYVELAQMNNEDISLQFIYALERLRGGWETEDEETDEDIYFTEDEVNHYCSGDVPQKKQKRSSVKSQNQDSIKSNLMLAITHINFSLMVCVTTKNILNVEP
jgi:hypothetical protein